MKLLIDAGNSRTKWAWCPPSVSHDSAWQVHSLDNTQWFDAGAGANLLQAAMRQADEIWLSNVAGERWLQRLPALEHPLHIVQAVDSVFGLRNHYTQPQQLGSDRWCSLLAVWRYYAQSALVVTAGTAMTIDALQITQQGADFLGGSIQPGLRLMWQSLQQGAAQLDYAYPETDAQSIGFARNSQQAMWWGCVQALTGAIAMQYARLAEQTEPSEQMKSVPLLLLSGGDAALLHRYLPQTLAARAIIVDNLVLKGLACLAEKTNE